jgi:hypothetical protein
MTNLISMTNSISMTRSSIRIDTMEEDEEYDEEYEPCHPWRETRPFRWQLEDYLNECSNKKKNVSRLDAMVKMACSRRSPGLVSKINIRMQLFVVGIFDEYPDMVFPMIGKMKEMLGSKSEYFTINMRINHEEHGNYLLVTLQIKKEIVDNLSELEYVFQQLEKAPSEIKAEVQEVVRTPLSEEEFPYLS